MRVILDTNFLIDVVRFKINLDDISGLVGSHEAITTSSVISELEKLSSRGNINSGYAKLALRLVGKNKIKIIKSDVRPDTVILEISGDDVVAATNDMELRKKLKAKGAKSIYLKSKKHLAIG